MNDSTLTQLKILVERAVRPVRVPTRRKLQMREELLAHVIAIFDEEASRPGDALERTRQRFGDPVKLTAALQSSASMTESLVGNLQHICAGAPANPHCILQFDMPGWPGFTSVEWGVVATSLYFCCCYFFRPGQISRGSCWFGLA